MWDILNKQNVVLKKANSTLKKFKRDESGIASLTWALSLTTIIAAMGAAMDFAILSAADARSQAIADTTALAAAIYVKNNEQIPQDRTKGLIGVYTASELGYDYRNAVINGSEGVTIDVTYDDVAREATVTVAGKTRPILMQILGYEELDFEAETVVKFYEKEPLDPASIVLVMDNSGSMIFDDSLANADGSRPNPHQSRIAGLEASAINFMTMLSDTVGPQDPDGPVPAVLRTGLMAFASSTTITRNMDWGVLANGEITAMNAGGATNSAPPLKTAKDWLLLPHNEPAKHLAESGKEASKYVILMTDGRNTVGDEEWVKRAGTENWRRYVTGYDSPSGLTGVEPGSDPTPSNTLVSAGSCSGGTWEATCYRKKNPPYNDYRITEGPFSYDPGTYDSSYFNNNNRRKQLICYSQVLVEETCTDDVYKTTWSGYEYGLGKTPPDGDPAWEEGEFDIESNILTRQECDELHNNDVKVFTVAFALEPGKYYYNNTSTITTSVENSNKARAILQYCASEEKNFITANDTAALQAAFDKIGNTIIKEIVRISS